MLLDGFGREDDAGKGGISVYARVARKRIIATNNCFALPPAPAAFLEVMGLNLVCDAESAAWEPRLRIRALESAATGTAEARSRVQRFTNSSGMASNVRRQVGFLDSRRGRRSYVDTKSVDFA